MLEKNNLSIRKFIKTGVSLVALAGLTTFGFVSLANADKYPSKPIQLVIHAKYGGGTDTTARMVTIRTRRNLDMTDIQIVAKRGGSGAKAQNYVLSRPADGYTIMALTQSHLYTMARGKSKMKIDATVSQLSVSHSPLLLYCYDLCGAGPLSALAMAYCMRYGYASRCPTRTSSSWR